MDRRIAAFQNSLIQQHIAEVENIYRQMRGWRHDYHNHIQTLKAYRALGQDECIDIYLDKLDNDLTEIDPLIKSGNIMADAILNSKLSLANARDIEVTIKAVVPPSLTISEIDLCVIVGNLLDNAIEACLRYDGRRFLRVYMDTKRENLYLSVTNSSGSAQKQGNRYISAKGSGFGLQRVEYIVDKYKGYLKANNEDGAFTAEVMLPL